MQLPAGDMNGAAGNSRQEKQEGTAGGSARAVVHRTRNLVCDTQVQPGPPSAAFIWGGSQELSKYGTRCASQINTTRPCCHLQLALAKLGNSSFTVSWWLFRVLIGQLHDAGSALPTCSSLKWNGWMYVYQCPCLTRVICWLMIITVKNSKNIWKQ
jgi:hypothetical protein